LNVPTYALKRLVNHSVSNDMTGRYLVLDLDRLRAHMTRITDAFIELFGIDQSVEPEWLIQKNDGSAEVIQLRLNFENEHPL
jgi:hypothetical protein